MASIRVWVLVGVTALSVFGVGVLAGSGGAAAADDVVTLTVTVEGPDGNPVQGAELTVTWEDNETTATTASNGKAFVDVPNGTNVSIEIDHDEYVRNRPYVVENATERDVIVGVARQGELVVRASHDDAPVADADVVVRKDGSSIVTGETTDDGTFESGVIEQGVYTFSIVKPGYFEQSHTVIVDDSVSRDVELERGSALLTVGLADDYYEEPRPIEAARVEIGEIASITTLDNGEGTVRVPVNTRLELTASKEGYSSSTRLIRVRESDRNVSMSMNREPQLTLTPSNERIVSGERLTVTVADEYDDPAEGTTIRLDGEDVGETGDDGALTFRIEETGEHEIVGARGDVESDPVTVRAVADETSTPTATPTATATPSPTPTATPTPTEGEGVGFGAILALVAVALSAILVLRRRNRR